MKVFKGLIYKELKLMKNWFMLGLALLILGVMIGFGLTKYFNEPNIFVAVALLMVVGYGLYLPAYLLSSLNIEGQTQLWLHNPNSGIVLFLAKLTAGIVFYFASFLLSIVIAIWGFKHGGNLESLLQLTGGPALNIVIMAVGITLGTLFLGVWVLFYWSLFHSLKNIPVLSSLRWPVVIGTWLLFTTFGNYVSNLPLYQKLKNIGVIKLNAYSFEIKTWNTTASAGFVESAELSMVNGIIYTVLVFSVFYAAVWLLERKVEV
ncbi:hypothetical protein J2Z40_001095 [Cytobacillus eiseniae]|uniref:ABC transporter permease n=1 Tax=Cytobacillus eiseniae TaxID=762947 RepID=A0ABS4RCB3_9BACI|nr:hypothetical protein [Cytobacillus eiseniae]MBP2240538.1 hypothetical protein [Cytobacillus eiseniae]